MISKETAIRYLTEYFDDSVDTFLYGSRVYSNNPSDTDAVVIREGDDFILFRGEIPKFGKSHIVIVGKDELYKLDKRRDIPMMARPPFSSLACPRELIYENEKCEGFHKEIYRMVSENVLDYVIPRLGIIFPYRKEVDVRPSSIIRFLRNEIAPFADPKLECDERPKYLGKWERWNAWKLTEGIISDSDVELYLQKHNMLIEGNNNLFHIKISDNSPSIEEDRRKIFEWRENKLKPAIKTDFSDLR